MKPLLCALPLLLLGLSTEAQSNRDDLTPLELRYGTALSEDLSRFEIELEVGEIRRPRVHVSMPAWTPGAYRLGNYGRAVEDLRAVDEEGRELEVTRLHTNSWSIDTDGGRSLRVTYSVPAAGGRWDRGDGDSEVTGRRLSGPSTYLYVHGAEGLPVRCTYDLPDGWKVANGLLPTGDPLARYARDYDTFIDAPSILGLFEERHFDVNGTPFQVVYFEREQQYDFDLDAFADVLRQIVTEQGRLFGSFPFPHYVFLCTIPGGGGLEHLNSTTIGVSAQAQQEDPTAGASLASHEFFHTWNVKRIRPSVLGPFDYQQENYTRDLWVSEGWTSYYGDLVLARTGLWDRDRYLSHLERVIARELNVERRKEHSVTWASRNTWHRFPDEEGSRVDYYGKGELLGCLIDLVMRHETGNQKTLDDVLRFLNRWFAERDVGFKEGDVERACTAISNLDFGEFFARHVHGTLDPPVAEILGWAGIDYRAELIECAFPFDLRGSRVMGRPAEGDEEQAAPRPGDRIRAVDGEDWQGEHAALGGRAAGDTLILTLERNGEQREVEVTLVEGEQLIPELSWMAEPSPEQLALREAWLAPSQ